MIIRTSCGHVFGEDWTADYFVFQFNFACPVCGSEQTVPPQNVLVRADVIESVDMTEWMQEQGLAFEEGALLVPERERADESNGE